MRDREQAGRDALRSLPCCYSDSPLAILTVNCIFRTAARFCYAAHPSLPVRTYIRTMYRRAHRAQHDADITTRGYVIVHS